MVDAFLCFTTCMERPCAFDDDNDLVMFNRKGGLSVGLIAPTVLVLPRPESMERSWYAGIRVGHGWLGVAVVLVGGC